MSLEHQPTERIKKQYLQMVPLKDFVWDDLEELSALQKQILEETCTSPMNSRRGPPLSYQRSFLKNMMELCEQSGSELCDEVYEAYGHIVSKPEEQHHVCHKSYVLPSGQMITLEESPLLISKGTTGLNTWPACLYLCEWALENKDIFNGRKVVELGSGVGLLGLLVCTCSSPRHYTFSDCHEHVLGALWRNLHINGFSSSITSPQEEKLDENFSVRSNFATSMVDHSDLKLGGPATLESSCGEMCSAPVASGSGFAASQGMFARGADMQLEEPRSLLSFMPQQNKEHGQGCFQNLQHKDDPGKQGNDASSVEDAAHHKQCLHEGCRTNKCDICRPVPFLQNQTPPNRTVKELMDGSSAEEQVSEGLCSSNTAYQKADINQHLTDVSVEELNWETVSGRQLERLSAGIVLAADVVYDVDIITSLTKVLHQLLSSPGDGKGKPTAFIASTIRNEQTYQCFLDKLDQCGISWSEMARPSAQVFYYDRSCNISLLKLQLQDTHH